ncbi:MAG: coniferyl aldehyde dehydrogenase [Brevundimonas sp.]
MAGPTQIADLRAILQAMKRARLTAGPADAALRRDRLARAGQLIRENHQALVDAMDADFGGRSPYQSLAADIGTTLKTLADSAEHLEAWMAEEAVEAPAPGMKAWIQPQPVGVVGVISPWNFPVNLAFAPLAGVFAAGNVALIKPSELTPRTSELIADLVARYFDPMELGVVLGEADVGAAFSALPFDHLVFTGGTEVGRHVMAAAAQNLTPVTLELGGKCPVFIDEGADLSMAVQRTLTVKTFNAGQICLSPDYVLVPAADVDAFVREAQGFMAEAFPVIASNPDYTAVVNTRHYDRLVDMVEDARAKGATIVSLAPAGEAAFDRATRRVAPVLILNADDAMLVMKEEIFGPLLPVVGYLDRSEATVRINAGPRPLAAYYFGDDLDRQSAFAAATTSGALVFNDVMTHASIDALPFGGVGASGMGAYHGVHGFRRFSHFKAVVRQSPSGETGLRLRAPYADKAPELKAALGF